MSIKFDPSVLTDSIPALAAGFATTIGVWIARPFCCVTNIAAPMVPFWS